MRKSGEGMEKFKRSFSIRKKRDTNSESSKPHQWQEDERKVREGSCSFQVKYLGCIEVFESRGIQVCEEAVKALKSRKSRSSWSLLSFRKKRDDSQQSKSNHHRAILYVTGDALRVVDEISKGLIVDQTIEKVSFCAPDRNHEKGFAYICRDGTTRRWMCHGFLAVKESGERLSHAVGCAFAICLEKKQQREKEKVTVTYNENGTSFTRLGSFRQTTLTERLADPQSAILAEPVPVKQVENPFALKRPHAPADIVERQGSFRSFPRLAESSPFKRNISLRVNELPSTLERQRQVSAGIVGPEQQIGSSSGISVIFEAEEQQDLSPEAVAAAVGQHLSNEFANLSTRAMPSSTGPSPSLQTGVSTPVKNQTTAVINAVQPPPNFLLMSSQPGVGTVTTSATLQASSSASSFMVRQHVANNSAGPLGPVHVRNPWDDGMKPLSAASVSPPMQTTTTSAASRVSDAEFWLNSTASQIDPFANVPHVGNKQVSTRSRSVNTGVSDPMLSPRIITTSTYPLGVTVAPQHVMAVHPQVLMSPHPQQAPVINPQLIRSMVPQPLILPNPPQSFAQQPLPFYSQQSAMGNSHVMGLPGPQHSVAGNSHLVNPQAAAFKSPAAGVFQPQFESVPSNVMPLSTSVTVTNKFDMNAQKQSQVAVTSQALDPFESAWAAKTTNRGIVSSTSINNPFQSGMENVTPAFQLKL